MSTYSCFYGKEFQQDRTAYIEDCYKALPEEDRVVIDRVSNSLMAMTRGLGVQGAHEVIFQMKSWMMEHTGGG